VSASRAYRLESGESALEGIARIALGRIDHAIDSLRGKTDSTPVEAVHEARKDMKKLRALLRLVRGELGEQVFRRESTCFRDAARELAGVRDADVMLETLEGLGLPAALTWELRKALQAHQSRDGGDGRGEAATRVVSILKEARKRVEQWPLERDSFAAFAEGLERSYRRGRRDLEAVLAEPTVEALHEWRKRVKELWYHHTLLRPAWPAVMEAVGNEAHELADRLGDDHDLAVLAEWAREHTGAGAELFEAVDRRRAGLQAEALALGARLYAEKPSAYVERLKRLWQAEARAPAGPRAAG
jgi:CHAD domain-containing protein